MISDTELTHLAQGGDSAALGALLERHRAHLYACALGYLGLGQDAEDAVQEACLLATINIGSLRNPDATGAWLRSIVRHVCLNALRARRELLPLADAGPSAPVDPARSLDERIDTIAARDWVWSAMAELSEATQSVMLLRFFGSYPSYEDIAATLDIPVGTVRSRLNQGRAQLAGALSAKAEAAHHPHTAERTLLSQQFASFCGQYNAGIIDTRIFERYRPDAIGIFQGERSRGVVALLGRLTDDVSSGMQMHPTQVIASSHVIVLEARWDNPIEDPAHCPPGMAHVALIDDGWVHSHRLFHAPRVTG